MVIVFAGEMRIGHVEDYEREYHVSGCRLKGDRHIPNGAPYRVRTEVAVLILI